MGLMPLTGSILILRANDWARNAWRSGTRVYEQKSESTHSIKYDERHRGATGRDSRHERRPCRPGRPLQKGAGRRKRGCVQGSPPSMRGKRPQQRSEEHTSELQSRENLVCRLLLEKKKRMRSCRK